MHSPQTGIFALGDSSHIFLEFSLLEGVDAAALVKAVAAIHEPRTTVGGLNFVVGFRPELWASVAPEYAPADARGFNAPIEGIEGFSMPATQSDAWLWLSGGSYDIIWDCGERILETLGSLARLDRETDGWAYHHNRDLTGFEDGTENPTLTDAPEIALVPDGSTGAGSSILLFQLWRHQRSWERLDVAAQEAAMGRTKADSIEFDEERMPDDSHVSRAKDIVDGEERDIFRRNVPYGNLTEYGTVFVGFSAQQSRLQRMLERMAGTEGGIRDALTRFTTPLTGAYYVVPSSTALKTFAPASS